MLPVDYSDTKRKKFANQITFDADTQTESNQTVRAKLEEENKRLETAWEFMNQKLGEEVICNSNDETSDDEI